MIELTLAVDRVSVTRDFQELTLKTSPKDRATVVAERVKSIMEAGGSPREAGRSVTPTLVLILPLEQALDVEAGAFVTVSIRKP